MYYIITDNKKILDFAKEHGADIIKAENPITVQTYQKKKFFNYVPKTITQFLKSFPKLDINSRGAAALEYILVHNFNCDGDLRETLYPFVAEHFKTTVPGITRAISCTYRNCVDDMPPQYRQFFSEYEFKSRYKVKDSFEFVRVCREYLKSINVI